MADSHGIWARNGGVLLFDHPPLQAILAEILPS